MCEVAIPYLSSASSFSVTTPLAVMNSCLRSSYRQGKRVRGRAMSTSM